MAYPEYVTVRNVSVGGAIGLETGQVLDITIQITATRSLVWLATGYRFEAVGLAERSEQGTEVVFQLPVTDQNGWMDARTKQQIVMGGAGSYTHEYVAVLRVGGNVYEYGPFIVPTGSTTLDLDKALVTGTVEAGQVPWTGQFIADQIAEPGSPANLAVKALAGTGGVSESRVKQLIASDAPVKSVNSKTGAVQINTDAEFASAMDTNGSDSYAKIRQLINQSVFMLTLYGGNALRNYPGTATPVALWQTVLWVSPTQPVNKQPHDLWFDNSTVPAAPVEPLNPVFVTSAFNRGTGANVTSATIQLPAGIQAGDLIIVAAMSMLDQNPATLSSTLTFADHGQSNRTGMTAKIFTRVASEVDTNQTITATYPTSAPASLAIAVFRPMAPIVAVANTHQGGTTGANQIIVPPFTPGANLRAIQIIFIARGTGAAAVLTPPPGVTMVASQLPTGTAAPRSGFAFGLGAQPEQPVGNAWESSNGHYASTWLLTLNVAGA